VATGRAHVVPLSRAYSRNAGRSGGAYGHSPLRTLIVGSTTTAMIRTVHVPVLRVR